MFHKRFSNKVNITEKSGEIKEKGGDQHLAVVSKKSVNNIILKEVLQQFTK